MRRFSRLLFPAMCCAACLARAVAAPSMNGDAQIRAPYGPSVIVVRTSSRVAGAIDSLTWNGMEFIDRADHGRELQSAWNGDAGHDWPWTETYNPTEGGSRDDGAGGTSSSRLLEIHAQGNTLETVSQPAFWLRPSELSDHHEARNTNILSDDFLRKTVAIGYKNHPNVLDYRVTITLATNDHNRSCVVEALTGYMPPVFSRFWTLDPGSGKLSPLSDGPGEQPNPILFSTPDGKFAMGIFSPSPKESRDATGPTYGRWRFANAHVVKWNCVYRLHNRAGLGGDYSYQLLVPIGTLADVQNTLSALIAEP